MILPEIRKFRTYSSRLALSNLLKIYQLAPHGFDRMFEAMNEIGIPEHRKYCAPLQALFWLIQDEKMCISGMLLGLKINKGTDKNGNCRPHLISKMEPTSEPNNSTRHDQDYSLEKILNAAWDNESLLMQRSNIYQIINRIQTQSEAEEYAFLVKRHEDLDLQSYIMDDFLKKREIFDVNDWQQIETAIDQSRWKTFLTVADRLNSPELVSYYINKKLSFRKTPASGVYFTFFDKKAQCTDAAYFAQFMLRRAGYKTFMRSVKWDDDPWDGLHTGAGIILEDGRYLLVSNYTGINSMSGPFSCLESLDQKLSCGRKIIDRIWGAYYPPRYY
ncbi:hypothetical protein [Desulfosarcina ovata]|nr:hypothetical protein [Desulfosarcina ovata]